MNANTLLPLVAALSMLGSASALAQAPSHPHPHYNPSDIVAMKPGQTVNTVTEAQLGNVPGWSVSSSAAAQITLKPGQQSS
jgi:hypothetical protein